MFKNNLKITLTVLKRKKLFSVITILGIAIPLTFLMIVISAITHIAAFESPQSDFDRILLFDRMKYSIERENSFSGNMSGNPSYDFVKNYIKTMKTPENVGVFAGFNLYNFYQNNRKTKLNVAYTDRGFWDIADFKFVSGKAFSSTDVASMQQVAVIDEFTKKLIFGNEIAIGQHLKIFRKDYTVIGVVKNVDRVRTRTYANVYLPITTSNSYSVKDILGSGVTCLIQAHTKDQFSQIESEFNHIINNFQLSDYNGLTKVEAELRNESFNTYLQSLVRGMFSIHISKERTIYFGYAIIFFFFILLPCINLLYIHISRINERSSEIGVRKSFGGNKPVLTRQFVFENITITIISGFIALIFTLLFCTILNKSNVIPGLHLKLNITSLLVTLFLWLIFGVATGILPAFRMSRMKIIDALHQHDSHQFFDFVVWKAKRLKMLLVVEFIITFVGLASIGMVVFKFQKNNSAPLGFEVEDVYRVSVNIYDDESIGFGYGNYREEILNVLKEVEGSSIIHTYGRWRGNEPYHEGHTTFCGRESELGVDLEKIYLTEADENMDKILGLEIISGRWFSKTDKIPDSHPVVISQNFKEKLFGEENAIGETIEIMGNKLQIIGVINHYKNHGEFSKQEYMLFHVNVMNNICVSSWGSAKGDFFKVKPGITQADVNELTTKLSQKYPNFEIEITPLTTHRAKYFMKIWGPIITLLIVFAFVMLIVLLGLFGVLWYNVSLRKTEIGLRRAVGANQNRIFTQVIKEMLSWASIGIIIGIVLLVQIPVLKLFPVEIDVFTASVLSSAFIIYLLIIVCSLIPGIQAANIQPAIALHQE